MRCAARQSGCTGAIGGRTIVCRHRQAISSRWGVEALVAEEGSSHANDSEANEQKRSGFH